jgi:diaminopimelate decarboxylase
MLIVPCGSGFDVASAGEVQRVLQAGVLSTSCCYRRWQTDKRIQAKLEPGILMFNVKSKSRLDAIT